jgi:uncharacterized protein (TIGR03435 family)
MKRTIHIVAAAATLMAPLMMALPHQQPSTLQTFEVATVRPYKDDATAGGVVMVGGGCRGFDSPAPGTPGNPGAGGTQMAIAVMAGPGGSPPPGRVAGPPTTPIGRCRFTRMSLKNLINAAYRLTALGGSLDQLITGGPNWVGTDTFDIEAKAEDAEHTSQDQLRVMLQNLLIERFNLKFHREKKEMPGFDLVVAKSGLKMKPAEGSGPGGGMSMSLRGPGMPMTTSSEHASMTNIISFLSGRLGRAIQDKTGLTGNYQFSLNWTPGEGESGGLMGMMMQPPPGAAGNSASEPGVSLFTALQEQMGLRLEASKVMLDVFVIDSADKPAGQ